LFNKISLPYQGEEVRCNRFFYIRLSVYLGTGG
jgi:hypothetical protein